MAQIKYYGENSTITWKSISTYIAYSSKILTINEQLLVTNDGVKMAKIIKYALPIKTYDFDSLMRSYTTKKINLIESINSLFSNKRVL
jgi:hypothetical protein